MSSSEIKFRRNKSHTKVYACYSLRMPNLFEIDDSWVNEQLQSHGFGDYITIDANIQQLVTLVNNTENGTGKIQVATSVDAKVTIKLVDEMSATMTITPPVAGRPASLDMVKKALAENGIRHGFLLDEIKVAIVSGKANNLTIAQAFLPENGEDAQFICTLPEIKIRTEKSGTMPKSATDNGNDVTVVEQGDSVMRRIPATPGTPSKNILGETLEPIPGTNTPFSLSLEGVSVSDDDPDVLIASVSGQPIIVKNGICIEKTMSVSKVDLSTGNVIFEGAVIVNGNVSSGMIVQALRDITVKGTVENAILDSGGNILIRGAVVGKEDKKKAVNPATVLRANGSITAKFIENASIKSNDSIYAQDWVLKSDLNAFNNIEVGHTNSSKGQITGGNIYAGLLIKALKLGSSASAKTRVEVGVFPNENTHNHQRKTQERVLIEIQKKIDAFTHNHNQYGKEMLLEAKHAYACVESNIAKFKAEQKLMDDEKVRTENAKIIIGKTIYAGVTLVISGKKLEPEADLGKRALAVKDGRLTHLFDQA